MNQYYTLVFDWQWAAPLLLILGGLIIGIMVERTLIAALQKAIDASDLDLSDRVGNLFQGVIFWLFTLGGLYMASYSLSFMGEALLAPLRRLLFILSMLITIRLISNVALAFVRFYMSRHESLKALPNTSILENIVRVAVYIVGLLVLLQSVGVSVIPILTALGVGGLAISLALQDTLANIFAGINMLLARQIKIGDFVKLEGGYEGTIEDISWRNTSIRMLNNNIIIVPNSKMASSIITNCTLPLPEMSLTLEAAVSYDSNLAEVERISIEVAKEVLTTTEGAIPDFEPFVRFHTLGESSVNFSIILRVQNLTDQFLVKHEFYKRLHARYQREGIEIPYPQRVLHFDPALAEVLDGKPNGQKTRAKKAVSTEKPQTTGREKRDD